MAVWDERIEENLLHLHTAFLGRIVSTDGKTAKVQPLSLVKQYGQKPMKQAPVEDVPILQTVKKYREENCPCSTVEHPRKHIVLVAPEIGDIVCCLCCERDITETKTGKEALPAPGHHQIHDAIIVGVL